MGAVAKAAYEVDPNNEKLLDVKAEGADILRDSNAAYDTAIDNNNATSKELQGQIDANTNDLVKAQQAQSDLAIQGIKNDMAEAEKDYLKEQSAAYVDYQKQIDPYGINAERIASLGLSNSGYAESSKVAMYNQYQNRVAIAREAYTRATTDFKLGIAEAKAANSVALAEIRANALAQSLEIAMQFAMQNNSLLTEKARQQTAIRQQNFQNYMSVYDSIMQENALIEDVRQFNAQISEEKRQFNATMAENKRQFNVIQAVRAAAAKAKASGGGSSKKSASVKKSKAAVDKIVKGKVARDTANDKPVKKSSPTVDMNSVLKLGYGPISEQRLSDLVDSGKVVQYVEDGKIKFKPNFNY